MIDYLNGLSDRPFLAKRAEPEDPALNVIHRSEQHQVFYRTSEFDRNGTRVHQEELAPPPLCRIDCRDAEPRNEAMAVGLQWRPVAIAPIPAAHASTRLPGDAGPMVDRLLEAARRDDASAIDAASRDFLGSAAGQAWLAAGEQRLRQELNTGRAEPEQHRAPVLELQR